MSGYLDLIEAIAAENREVLNQRCATLQTTQYREQILQLSLSEQATLVIEMVQWSQDQQNQTQDQVGDPIPAFSGSLSEDMEMIQKAQARRHWQFRRANVGGVMKDLMKRPLLFNLEQLVMMLDRRRDPSYGWLYAWHLPEMTRAIERYLKNHPDQPCPDELREAVEAIRQVFEIDRKVDSKLERLVRPPDQIRFPMVAGEVWAEAALAYWGSLPLPEQRLWLELLDLILTNSAGTPNAKWLKSAQPYVQKLGSDSMATHVKGWFAQVDQGRTTVLERRYHYAPDPNLLLDDRNADILKGLVWLTPEMADPELASAVAKLAISAYRKVPQVGPRCVRLGNACVWALGSMPPELGIPQLIWLQAKVKFGTAQKGIDKMFNQVAERVGLPRHEIEEMAVPSYGMEAVGSRREVLGEFTAELVVTGTSSTELRWFKPDGKPQKSVPAAVKADFAEDLKELKQAAQEIQKMIPAQRQRIEGLYLESKTWDFAIWRERYLDHPLVGTLARRLIWQFVQEDRIGVGIWHQGQLVNEAGDPLLGLETGATKVQLWHPIHASTETILRWRQWLIEHQIQQPFKQAHREVYLLTPAEESTQSYSNRFAAHILKQHIFHALCGQRGWKNKLRLMVDDDAPPPMRMLTQYGIRAEFWVGGLGQDITDSATFLYVGTDQVRFYPEQAALNYAHVGGGIDYHPDRRHGTEMDPLPVDQIPALVFSEIMRDVDLFVGVASVGNDPTWSDGGRDGLYRGYWYGYSFGTLNASAQTRRQVLETLIPRLKIAKQCHFEDKFLVVKGSFCTYKIHLGSGNILMDPGDRYLCIVSNQLKSNDNDSIFLPFEGDTTLSLILSKALLLANDTKIKDQTILAQINTH